MRPTDRRFVLLPLSCAQARLRRGTLASLLVLGPLLAATMAGAQTPTCRQLKVSPQLSWLSSLAFQSTTGDLLLVDPAAKQIVKLATTSGASSPLELAGLEQGLPAEPMTLTETGDRLFLKLRGSRGAFLDPASLRPTGAPFTWLDAALDQPAGVAGGSVSSLYTNWIFHAGYLLGYGGIANPGVDVRNAGDEARKPLSVALGVLRAGFDASSGRTSQPRLLLATDENDYYRIGYPFFAATESGAYFLRMVPGQEVALFKVTDTAPFISEVKVRPTWVRDVPALRQTGSVYALMNELATLSVVSGLYGQGNSLYVLSRRPSPSGGGTEWELHQVDLGGLTVTGTLRLPTTADHLNILPTTDSWYVVERPGEVAGFGKQAISSVLEIPRSWIADPASSDLNAVAPRVLACGADGQHD